jgi:hypothetical protein
VVAAGCAGLGVPFPSGPYGDYAPAWSPDGLEIAFSGLRTDGGIGYVLYVTDLSGNVVQLTTEQGESPSRGAVVAARLLTDRVLPGLATQPRRPAQPRLRSVGVGRRVPSGSGWSSV